MKRKDIRGDLKHFLNPAVLKHSMESVTCVSTWAKAVPCVADSVLLLMLYFRTLLDQNTSELFITVNDDYQQQLTTTNNN